MGRRLRRNGSAVMRVAGSVLAGVLIVLLLDLSIARPIGGPGTGVDVAAIPAIAATPAPSAAPPATPEPSPPSQVGTARPPDLAPLDAAQSAALQSAVERARQAYGLDALAVGVSYGGARRWTGASGLARDGITPLTGDSPFGIASISKTFVASVVLQLVDEGRIRLTDRVAELLPGVTVPAGVTVRQLLDHTSGLADLFSPLRDDLNAYPDRLWTPQEVLARVGGPWFVPGADWAYSNTNYLLLGLIVERVTGLPLAGQVRTRLLEPFLLVDSGTVGEDGSPPLLPPSWASAFWSSGSMYASAGDLLRWGEALYGGSVLTRRSLFRMLQFNEDGYGLGAERMSLGEAHAVGHSGLLKGFTTLLVHVPDSDVTVAVLATSSQKFNPGELLARAEVGAPSILDLVKAYLPAGGCELSLRTGCPE